MEFDREALDTLLNQKLERAQRAIVRNYLTKCGVGGGEIGERIESIIAERGQNAVDIAAELESARQTIAELEGRIAEQRLEFAVSGAMSEFGVKPEHYDDVRLLAADKISAAADSSGEVDCEAVRSAIADVIRRIPTFAEDTQRSGAAGFTGHMGNFARNDDGAAIMKNRLNSARAAGNNALSVSIISEAAAMGISLR